jgi:ArsR family transcriptional regulator
MKYSYAEYVPMMKALSDETRLKIIDMLSCGEMCACKILEAFNITQPTLSYHMKILSESGLVKAVRDGAWMRYSLNSKKSRELSLFLEDLIQHKSDCICNEYLENLDVKDKEGE